VTVTFRAAAEPLRSRRDYWQYVVSEAMGPLDVQIAGDIGDGDRLVVGDLGAVRVGVLDAARPGGASRRSRHLRTSDPDLCKIDIVAAGHGVVEQDGRESHLRPGDLTLVDLTRPVRWQMAPSRMIAVIFPRVLLPLDRSRAARLTAVRVPGDRGTGAVISSLARTLAEHLDDADPAERTRLGTAVVDLATVALAARADDAGAVPAGTRQRALLMRIQAFVEERLRDPELSPGAIADAHFISVRYLHRLFEQEELTVGGWIRERRLDRCRRDLSDPALAGRPVSAIGAAWGITNPSHFSRLFRAEYGLPPAEYRAVAVEAGPRHAR
jgi:AraC-like DNA-binding protein